MANPFSKGWKYLTASLDSKFEENADPEIQIKQALDSARKQHAEIAEAASSVIAHRNQLEMKLNRLAADAEKLATDARTALSAADKAATEGDQAKATQFNHTAELFATQLVAVEQQLEETKKAHQVAADAAQQAQQQKEQSDVRLQKQIEEANTLRTQINQAKMQEHTAAQVQRMQGITADDNVPSLDSVRDKIEQRYAAALGAQELTENSVAGRMAEIESAGRDFAASSRLEQIRAEMSAGNGADKPELSNGNTENKKEITD